MSKRVAILQSNYIPWKGYFDLIASVDEFVLYDDMQFTKRDWRNRNKIKTSNGLSWLTVPVETKDKYFQSIRDTRISDRKWAKKHWASISHAYSRAEHFKDYKEVLEGMYLGKDYEYLSDMNYDFITHINKLLGIETVISWSGDFDLVEGKSERLLGLCKDLAATTYLSGPAAKDYLDEELFRKEGVAVEWMDYSGYPEYDQLHGEFEHGVSVLDMLFNCGGESPRYMKCVS